MNAFTVKFVELTSSAALPDPAASRPPGFEFVDTMLAWFKWGGLTAAVFALVAAAIMLFMGRNRDGGWDAGSLIIRILLGVVVIGAAASIIGTVAA